MIAEIMIGMIIGLGIGLFTAAAGRATEAEQVMERQERIARALNYIRAVETETHMTTNTQVALRAIERILEGK